MTRLSTEHRISLRITESRRASISSIRPMRSSARPVADIVVTSSGPIEGLPPPARSISIIVSVPPPRKRIGQGTAISKDLLEAVVPEEIEGYLSNDRILQEAAKCLYQNQISGTPYRKALVVVFIPTIAK